MKIGYFGNPNHSADLLARLIKEDYSISFVVTNPDQFLGRKKILTPTPVKEIATKNYIPVLQFNSIKNETAVKEINDFNADIYIIYAYGKLIPSEIFSFPRLGSINLHGSLLPDLRGASPVQTALLNNYTKTGISLQYIVKELDAGDIIDSMEIPIELIDTTETLLQKMTTTGFYLLNNLLKKNTAKKFPATPQDNAKATHCKKLTAVDRKIDFTKNAIEIHNQIRAFNPSPYAYCSYRQKRLNIITTTYTETNPSLDIPGTLRVIAVNPQSELVDKKQLQVNCGDRPLIIEILQPENKNPIKAIEFINGYRIKDGDILE